MTLNLLLSCITHCHYCHSAGLTNRAVQDECSAARGALALAQLDAQCEPWSPLTVNSTIGESPAADVTTDGADYTTDAAVQWQAVVDAVTRQPPPSVRPPPGPPGGSDRGQLKVCILGGSTPGAAGSTVGPTVGPTAVPTAVVEAAAWCGLAVCSMAGAHAAAAAAVSEAEASAAAASAAAAAEAARLQVHSAYCTSR
jgi:hypothetical protein